MRKSQRDCLRLFFLLFLSKWSWRKSLSLVVIVSDVDLASCSSSLSIRDTLMGFPQNRRLFNQWKYLGANVNLTSNSDVKSWYSPSDLQCREPWKKSPPIQHFHCSTFRHCKLLFANLSRTNFSICYKLPQILKLLQISRRDCIFARAAPTGTFPAALVTYLFDCAPNVHLQPTLETFDRKIWICRTMRCRPTWDQNIKGSATH